MSLFMLSIVCIGKLAIWTVEYFVVWFPIFVVLMIVKEFGGSKGGDG